MLIPKARSISLAGLVWQADAPWGSTVRSAFTYFAQLGYQYIHLDASHPELRPRTLDRSARRDLASLLRQVRLQFAGLDLWIPPEHFADARHADRAVEAVQSACDLAADLARLHLGQGLPPVCIQFLGQPKARESLHGIASQLATYANRVGVLLADHAWPVTPSQESTASNKLTDALAVGIDPATILMGGGDPATEVLSSTAKIASARLSDANNYERVTVGTGRIDLLAYEVALHTSGFSKPLVVDLRGVRNQILAATSMAPPPAP